MERLWNWHQTGKRTDNIDSFIANLQKANSQNGILLKHQKLEVGDISSSVSTLLVMAAQSPSQTNKVVKAALEMNKYLNIHYANLSSEDFNAEKLTIPAMLDTLEPQIKQNVKDPSLITKVHFLVAKTKKDFDKDSPNNYNTCVSVYKDVVSSIQNQSQTPKRQPTISQQILRNNKGPVNI